jgi:hypothetical protein
MVYYGQPTDNQPKKSVDLKECVIRVESKKEYDMLPAEERKSQETSWKEEALNYRVAIISSNRNNKPVYTYASTKEETISITMQINNAISTNEDKNQLKSLIKYVSDSDKFVHFTSIYIGAFLSSAKKILKIKK